MTLSLYSIHTTSQLLYIYIYIIQYTYIKPFSALEAAHLLINMVCIDYEIRPVMRPHLHYRNQNKNDV